MAKITAEELLRRIDLHRLESRIMDKWIQLGFVGLFAGFVIVMAIGAVKILCAA